MNDKIKILFVDDDKYILDGLKRSLISQRANWEMYFAISGYEAIELSNSIKFDVIVTDMRMPVMNGAEVLEYFYRNFPHTIRIILSGHSDHELILKTVKTSHQFLTKPINTEELTLVINNCLKSRELINSKELIELVNSIDKLPSLPEIYLEIEKELNKESISLINIEKIIAKDISITAKILQVANSSYFASAVRTADIKVALNILGVNVIKSLVLVLNLNEYFKKDKINETILGQIWDHSFKTAEIANMIVKELKISNYISKEIFATALLHDIGKLILTKNHKYLNLIESLKRLPTYNEEIELLKFSHTHVGAYLLKLWNLPDITVEAVASHHEKQELNENSLSSLLHYADKIINKTFDINSLNEKEKNVFQSINFNFTK